MNPTALQIVTGNSLVSSKDYTIAQHNNGFVKEDILVQFINDHGEIISEIGSNPIKLLVAFASS